jgi:hypothetical protein
MGLFDILSGLKKDYTGYKKRTVNLQLCRSCKYYAFRESYRANEKGQVIIACKYLDNPCPNHVKDYSST